MARSSKNAPKRVKVTRKRAASVLTDEAVKAYLADHPDFLVENEELLQVLTPPTYHSGRHVVDFQRYSIERLRHYLTELDAYQGRLIAATRSNISNQQQIHDAVLAAMDAESLPELVHTVTQDWVDMLGVDAIVLALEDKASLSWVSNVGILPLEACWIEDMVGLEGAVIRRGRVAASPRIFGPAAPLIQAEAMVRMAPAKPLPQGLLAFGTRESDSFYPGQGTELLRFLASVVQKCLKPWFEKTV